MTFSVITFTVEVLQYAFLHYFFRSNLALESIDSNTRPSIIELVIFCRTYFFERLSILKSVGSLLEIFTFSIHFAMRTFVKKSLSRHQDINI